MFRKPSQFTVPDDTEKRKNASVRWLSFGGAFLCLPPSAIHSPPDTVQGLTYKFPQGCDWRRRNWVRMINPRFLIAQVFLPAEAQLASNLAIAHLMQGTNECTKRSLSRICQVGLHLRGLIVERYVVCVPLTVEFHDAVESSFSIVHPGHLIFLNDHACRETEGYSL